jgi:hypothetical protein
MLIAGTLIVAQALTFAIPIGTLTLVCIWGFFQRRPTQ